MSYFPNTPYGDIFATPTWFRNLRNDDLIIEGRYERMDLVRVMHAHGCPCGSALHTGNDTIWVSEPSGGRMWPLHIPSDGIFEVVDQIAGGNPA